MPSDAARYAAQSDPTCNRWFRRRWTDPPPMTRKRRPPPQVAAPDPDREPPARFGVTAAKTTISVAPPRRNAKVSHAIASRHGGRGEPPHAIPPPPDLSPRAAAVLDAQRIKTAEAAIVEVRRPDKLSQNRDHNRLWIRDCRTAVSFVTEASRSTNRPTPKRRHGTNSAKPSGTPPRLA